MTPRPAALGDKEIEAALAGLDGWERRGDAVVKSFVCPTFADAVAFVVRVGFLAEHADHHPDIDIRWRTVTALLTTHDAPGLTALDFALAVKIDEVAPP